MARINIDDSIHSDHRFIALMIALGGDYYKAIGLLVSAWKLGQKHHKEEESDGLIPHEVWAGSPFEKILECGLAEKKEKGVYVKGGKKQFGWLEQKSSAGSVGGKISAEKRAAKKKMKQNQASASNKPSESKQGSSKSKQSSSESKPPTLPPTLSLPHSIDLSINKNTGEILDFKNAQQKSVPEIMENLKSKGITITPDQVIDLFNSKLAGVGDLNFCRGLGSPSLLNMLDTFEKFPTLKDWEHLFDEVKKAKTITGEEPGVFKATLDWLSIRENALKADSGKYPASNPSFKKSTPGQSPKYDLTDDEIEKLDKAGEL